MADIAPPEVVALGVGVNRMRLAYAEDLSRNGGNRGRIAQLDPILSSAASDNIKSPLKTRNPLSTAGGR